MLGRFIRSSLPVRRFFCSAPLPENRSIGSNPETAQKLFRLRNPSNVGNVIEKLKKEGHAVSSDDISTAVRGMINHRRSNQALTLLDSLVEDKNIELKPQDYALHLGLISKVRGLASSEKYFEAIPEKIKDEGIYNALLNIYVKSGETAKAEALMEKMKGNGIVVSCRPYIIMMPLYMSNGKDDKVEEMTKEVKKSIEPKFNMYNMWLNACASANSVEAAEKVISEMKEAKVEPTWLTYGILASLYMKNKLFEKAASALKEKEHLIVTGDRNAHCSVLSQLLQLGDSANGDAVLRIFEQMKSKFGKLKDNEYFIVVNTLLKLDLYEKAEEINSEWAAVLKERGATRNPILHRKMLELLKKAKDEKNSPPIAEKDKVEM